MTTRSKETEESSLFHGSSKNRDKKSKLKLTVEKYCIHNLCTYQCKAGGGGGRQGMGWGFDIFQKFAVKFPAHGQIIPVKCTKISPPRAAHCPYTDRSHWQKNRLRFSLSPFTLIPQYLKTCKSSNFGLSLFIQVDVQYAHIGRRQIQIFPPPLGRQDQSKDPPQGQQ